MEKRGLQLAYNNVPLRFQLSRRALKHESIVVHWCCVSGPDNLQCSLSRAIPNSTQSSIFFKLKFGTAVHKTGFKYLEAELVFPECSIHQRAA